MRLGLLGGTFDPIHVGHLVLASVAHEALSLDRVLFIPTGQPWQKPADGVSEARHRVTMTVLATEADPRFQVSRVDVDRPGPTYTVDTLRDIARERPEDDLFFLTGADALTSIPTWRDPQECLSLAHFVGVARQGFPLAEVDLPEDAYSLMEMPQLDISSTWLRRRVREGHSIFYLVPDPVAGYIAQRGLYVENGVL